MEEMIRESEAKTKWCPFARQSATQATHADGSMHDDGPTVNRWGDIKNQRLSRCIGSTCMAWQSPNNIFGYCGLVTNQEHAR
jgi:hypothetical protein